MNDMPYRNCAVANKQNSETVSEREVMMVMWSIDVKFDDLGEK